VNTIIGTSYNSNSTSILMNDKSKLIYFDIWRQCPSKRSCIACWVMQSNINQCFIQLNIMPRAVNSTFASNFFKQPVVWLYNSDGILESSYWTILVLANGMYCDNADSLSTVYTFKGKCIMVLLCVIKHRIMDNDYQKYS
jgi:hypothetical protein